MDAQQTKRETRGDFMRRRCAQWPLSRKVSSGRADTRTESSTCQGAGIRPSFDNDTTSEFSGDGYGFEDDTNNNFAPEVSFEPSIQMKRPKSRLEWLFTRNSMSLLKRDIVLCERGICAALNANCDLNLALVLEGLESDPFLDPLFLEQKQQFCRDLRRHIERVAIEPPCFINKVVIDNCEAEFVLEGNGRVLYPIARILVTPDADSATTLFKHKGMSEFVDIKRGKLFSFRDCARERSRNGKKPPPVTASAKTVSVSKVAERIELIAAYHFIDMLSGASWKRRCLNGPFQ